MVATIEIEQLIHRSQLFPQLDVIQFACRDAGKDWRAPSEIIRTASEIPIEVDLRDEDAVPIYVRISENVLHLSRLGMVYTCIAEPLGINLWMAKRSAGLKSRARLIRRVYEVDPLLCPCGPKMRVVGFIAQTPVIRKILAHIGRRFDPLKLPGRSPPLWDDFSPEPFPRTYGP